MKSRQALPGRRAQRPERQQGETETERDGERPERRREERERGQAKGLGENGDPTQMVHAVPCPPPNNNGTSTGLSSDIALCSDHGPCDICDLYMALCNGGATTSESMRWLVLRS